MTLLQNLDKIQRLHNANFRLSQALLSHALSHRQYAKIYATIGRVTGHLDYLIAEVKRQAEETKATASMLFINDAH